MAKLGTKIDPSKQSVKSGRVPVVLQSQSDSFIELKTPDELKQWEEDIRNFYGITVTSRGVHACETCSGGCSDDCGYFA